MESFFRTHAYLVEHTNAPVRRALMDEINWEHRLIGIKGARGVGKTTFLLQYAKERFNVENRECLYINMNNFYFQGKGIAEFAKEFYRAGGKVLLIDQVFKHPDWSSELRKCYNELPFLKIVFTGSSVMRLKVENPELNGIVESYNLRGFSFREFINLQTGENFCSYKLDDILTHHVEIASRIVSKINPYDYFQSYLHHGYYPFFLEKRNFSENLLKTMNMMLEVDILLIKQIELKYLSKIKKLLYLIATNCNKAPNVSHLAKELQVSRATIMNYIKYLSDARLINMIYHQGEDFPKKPEKIMMHNTNLMYTFYPGTVQEQDLLETFFKNTVWKDHRINYGGKGLSFIVDDNTNVRICRKEERTKKTDIIYARNGIEVGNENDIPLWLFGFLY